MRIILTSEFVTIAKKLLQKGHLTHTGKKVAFIQNGADVRIDQGETIAWVENTKDWYKNNGFIIDIIDLRNYHNEKELYNTLKNYNYIHVHGGDINHLSLVAKTSGFYDCIRKLLKQDIVYIGSSAGSILAGNEISYALITDIPYAKGAGLSPSGSLEGLGIHPFHIMPHANRIERQELAQKRLDYCIENNYNPYITLADYQAIVLDKDAMHFI